MTLSVTLSVALLHAHLNAGVILMVTVYSDRYIISLFPHLHSPFLPFSPSLIILMVSMDVKHRVYFTYFFYAIPDGIHGKAGSPISLTYIKTSDASHASWTESCQDGVILMPWVC